MVAGNDFLFTSESVSEGHPDKVCDQISDAILDAYLQEDCESRVACETMVTQDLVCVAGEVHSTKTLDVEPIIRRVIEQIGYVDADLRFAASSVEVRIFLHEQSPDIAQGVEEDEGLHSGQGAGDQGLMFGYACDQTDEFMPLPISLAHRLMSFLAEKRHAGAFPDIRPDAKSQVTVRYQDDEAVAVETVVISTQHQPDMQHKELEELMIESVIKKVIPANLLQDTRYLINPTGKFVVGGPNGDAGLTGRKIIVDTYGGWSRHGGGAFSGKDPSKVDRSAAYMARYAAKNIVAAGLAKECELQIAYAIGYPQPVSINVRTNQSSRLPEHEIAGRIQKMLDFSPRGIIEILQLLSEDRRYEDTAKYGHFGRRGKTFSWEKLDQVEALSGK